MWLIPPNKQLEARNMAALRNALAAAEERNAVRTLPPRPQAAAGADIVGQALASYEEGADLGEASRRLTGFTLADFENLCGAFQDAETRGRGRAPKVVSFRNRFFILLVWLHTASLTTVEVILRGVVSTPSSIYRLIKSTAESIHVTALSYIRYTNEVLVEFPQVGAIVDCTVCPIPHPARPFEDAKAFYSKKHERYCYKKEVFVNPVTGTACSVSKAFPGKMHDWSVFLQHFEDFKGKLGARTYMGDSAYIGGVAAHGAVISRPRGTPVVSSKRVIVERYFGRLKHIFPVLRHTFALEPEYLDIMFDISCALTNFHIAFGAGLNAVDEENNMVYLEELSAQVSRRRETVRLAQMRYRERKKASFESSCVRVAAAEEEGNGTESETDDEL